MPLFRLSLRHKSKTEFRYIGSDAFSRASRRDIQRGHFRATDKGEGRGKSHHPPRRPARSLILPPSFPILDALDG